jgi:AcrR family transcriptional regulator
MTANLNSHEKYLEFCKEVSLKSGNVKGLRYAARVKATRPSWRPTPGSPASSDRTRVEILWAAERVLATAGHAAFTIRAVAAVAGITPGNLAYHFSTKRELLRAVITSMIAEYNKKIDDFLKTPTSDGSDAFAELVTWLIYDSTNPVTSRLFRELWVMSLHDRFVSEAVDRLYTQTAKRMMNVLQQSHPELGMAEAKEIVYLLLMICEGSNPIYGIASRHAAPISKVSNLAVKALQRLAKGA